MTRPTKTTIFVAAAALLICYASTLAGMADQWMTDEDMGHGFAVPFVVGWVVMREKDNWIGSAQSPSHWGWLVLLAGAGMQFVSMVGAGLFAGSVALLISAAGLVVTLGGFGLLRAWAFPLLLSVCMLPKLAVVYNQVTLPLQLFASKAAAYMLLMLGAAVRRSGNILEIGGHQISVAEACSGIRYLLPLVFLSLVIGYLASSKLWLRIALVATSVPLAIFANAVRVAGSAWSPTLAEGTPHALMGLVIFMLCLAALAGLSRVSIAVGESRNAT